MDEDEISTLALTNADEDIYGVVMLTSTSIPGEDASAVPAKGNVDAVHRIYQGNLKQRVTRRAANLAWANGITGFRANVEPFGVMSVTNTDPPLRMVEAGVKSFIPKLKELEAKNRTLQHPSGEGVLLALPASKEGFDARGYFVCMGLVDYLELVARARHLVFTD